MADRPVSERLRALEMKMRDLRINNMELRHDGANELLALAEIVEAQAKKARGSKGGGYKMHWALAEIADALAKEKN